MKASAIKSEQRITTFENVSQLCINYDVHNNYPQKCEEIIDASSTGSSCLDTYFKFCYGRGFYDEDLATKIVNSDSQTADDVLRLCVKDYCKHNGFVLHANINRNLTFTDIRHIPFKNARKGLYNEEGVSDTVVLCDDWTGLKKLLKLSTATNDIEVFPLYTENKELLRKRIEKVDSVGDDFNLFGSSGVIVYFTPDINSEYTKAKYDNVLTDMRTEEGLSNVTARNVCSNFIGAGMLVDISDVDETKEQESKTKKELREYQGDSNSHKLFYAQVRNSDDIPKYIPFTGNNTDNSFKNTAEFIPDVIGRAFKQHPVLRAKEVGTLFSKDVIKEAYNLYNAFTQSDVDFLSDCFRKVFSNLEGVPQNTDTSIQRTSYESGGTLKERFGDSGVSDIMSIIDSELPEEKKRSRLSVIYGLTDNEIDDLL